MRIFYTIAVLMLVGLAGMVFGQTDMTRDELEKSYLKLLDAQMRLQKEKVPEESLQMLKEMREHVEDLLQAVPSGGRLSIGYDCMLRDLEAFKQSPASRRLTPAQRRDLMGMIESLQKMAANPGTSFADFPLGNVALPTPKIQRKKWHRVMPETIRRGDIVMRCVNGLWSEHFKDVSTREKRFTHAGIVLSNGVDACVCHIGTDWANGGCVVRGQRWRLFCKDCSDCAVYRLTGSIATAEKIARQAEALIGVPFDPAFDLHTTNRLYCTEMVRCAVNKAVGRELIGTTYDAIMQTEIVAPDDCYRKGMTKIFDARGAE